MQRLASKHIKHQGFTACIALWSLFLVCSACSHRPARECERLNDIAYAWQYRSLDTVRIYADSVLGNRSASLDARAEALNNLAFYYIGRMRYAEADSVLALVDKETDNHVELLVADVQRMRLCQRQSKNKKYYENRQSALSHLARLKEEDGYTERQQRRIRYAETELKLVTSVYQYYVGQTDDATASLMSIDSLGLTRQDTAQMLAYIYNVGAGGIITRGTREQITHTEYDYLLRLYAIAAEGRYAYWQANALQAIAEHIVDDGGEYFRDNRPALNYINRDEVPDTLLAGNLAERAINLFAIHGDVYQQSAAWRTLSRCYSALGDYGGAVFSLRQAERVDSTVRQAPALMASICELFSMAFSALDNKPESDYYRNRYLDLYEDTRQDRSLEARAEQLRNQVSRLDALILSVLVVIVVMIALLVWLVVRRRERLSAGKDTASGSLRRLRDESQEALARLDEKREELEEQIAMTTHELSRQETTYAEGRAKQHLIDTFTPLLDRLLHETQCLATRSEDEALREQRRQYISELLDRINHENVFLTRWIQLRRGELSLRIETFALQPLLDIVEKGAHLFSRQGITLRVEPTSLCLKADRTLTLFIINTLCDNARKFTPSDGTVTVTATDSGDGMAEISVADSGEGMTEEQVAKIFDVKPIRDDAAVTDIQQSHGFGLQNCKGIIEKYKKTNALFARCRIGVESAAGKGTRVFFRLPQGGRALLVALLLLPAYAMYGKGNVESLADSVYQANVDGRYADAVRQAKACLTLINAQYRATAHTAKSDTLLLNDTLSVTPAEVRWIRGGIAAPYETLLLVRNEVAVAALALHDWQLYHYNNNAYSLLYRENTADTTLAAYCERMEETGNDSRVAIILLVSLLVALAPLYYFAYYRHIIGDISLAIRRLRAQTTERQAEVAEITARHRRLAFERDRLHVANNVVANSFSAIKHETMYYPSRLAQLLADGDDFETDAVARYYRELFSLLAAQARYNCRIVLPPTTLRRIMHETMHSLATSGSIELLPKEQGNPYDTYRLTIKHEKSCDGERREALLRLLTQTVRDLGELYTLHRCGVTQEADTLIIAAPAEETKQVC